MQTNVEQGDVAYLAHPLYPENKYRICEVVQRIPNQGAWAKHEGVVWFCRFPTPIKCLLRQAGEPDVEIYIDIASIEDWRLKRLAGPSCMREDDVTKKIQVPA